MKRKKFSLTDKKMQHNFINRTGMKYGKLTCTDKFEKRGVYVYWHCICECGNETDVRAANLASGSVISCGCAKNHVNKVHGMSHSRLHNIWSKMNERCYNPNHKHFKNYGGRGIGICESWKGTEGFINFYKWALENGYSDSLTIDRINNDKGYSPDNCRWADRFTQANNARNVLKYEYNGKSYTIRELSNLSGIPKDTLYQRLRNGWNVEEALSRRVREIKK